MSDNFLIDGWEDEQYKAFVDKFRTKKTTTRPWQAGWPRRMRWTGRAL